MRLRAFASGLGLSVALASTSAAAAPTAPEPPANARTMTVAEYPTCVSPNVSKEDSEAAHQQYTVGKVKYDEADYSEAVARFLRAYKLDCNKHELLVIMSRAFDLAGNKAEAIHALETFMKRASLSTAERSSIEARIGNMKRQLATDPPAAPPSSVTPPAPAPAPAPAAPPERQHTIYPWLVVGAGAVAIGVGAVVYVVAPALPDECRTSSDTCSELPGDATTPGYEKDPTSGKVTANPALDERKNQAGRHVGMTTGGLVTMIGGGVLVAGGLIWHFVEPTGARVGKRPTVTPAIAPGYAGVGIGGHF